MQLIPPSVSRAELTWVPFRGRKELQSGNETLSDSEKRMVYKRNSRKCWHVTGVKDKHKKGDVRLESIHFIQLK